MRGNVHARFREELRRGQGVLAAKVREALASVLPITLIVLVLCVTVAPVPPDILLAFLAGAAVMVGILLLVAVGSDTVQTTSGLRRKVDAGFDKKLIHTVRGVGWVLREDK